MKIPNSPTGLQKIVSNEKVLNMRKFLIVLIIILSFQSWIKADEIKSISIEGISLGDSALKFFSKQDIINNTFDYYNVKKYVPVQMDNYDFFEIYDAVDFTYKAKDPNYIIQKLNGVLIIEDINLCENQLDTIVNDIKPMISSAFEIEKSRIIHDNDPSGQSYIIEKQWVFPSGDRILVQCYHYSKSHGGQNHLALSIRTKEFHNFLRKIAYKKIS